MAARELYCRYMAARLCKHVFTLYMPRPYSCSTLLGVGLVSPYTYTCACRKRLKFRRHFRSLGSVERPFLTPPRPLKPREARHDSAFNHLRILMRISSFCVEPGSKLGKPPVIKTNLEAVQENDKRVGNKTKLTVNKELCHGSRFSIIFGQLI